MPQGTVTFHSGHKGYVFIRLNGGRGISSHACALERVGIHTFVEGERAAFEIEPIVVPESSRPEVFRLQNSAERARALLPVSGGSHGHRPERM